MLLWVLVCSILFIFVVTYDFYEKNKSYERQRFNDPTRVRSGEREWSERNQEAGCTIYFDEGEFIIRVLDIMRTTICI